MPVITAATTPIHQCAQARRRPDSACSVVCRSACVCHPISTSSTVVKS